jgi:hypothetical protein
MYNFIRKNNKKLLAVFAAFLMIVFILPVGMGQMGGTIPSPDASAARRSCSARSCRTKRRPRKSGG